MVNMNQRHILYYIYIYIYTRKQGSQECKQNKVGGNINNIISSEVKILSFHFLQKFTNTKTLRVHRKIHHEPLITFFFHTWLDLHVWSADSWNYTHDTSKVNSAWHFYLFFGSPRKYYPSIQCIIFYRRWWKRRKKYCLFSARVL